MRGRALCVNMAWNRPYNSRQKETRRKCGRRGIPLILFVALILLGFFCVVLFLIGYRNSGGDSPSRPDKKKQIVNVSRRKVAGASHGAALKIDGKPVEKPSAENVGIVLEARKGRVVKWAHREEPLFKNDFENYIVSFITATPGERFFEIDIGDEMDESFKASLTNNIVVKADDPAEIAAIKNATIQAKEEIRMRMAEGMRPSEVLVSIRDEMNKIADMRDKLQDEFNAILLKGTDPAEVLKFAKEANELLAEYDALPLDAPDDVEDAYDALEAAKEAAIEEIEAADRKAAAGKKEKEGD